MRKYILIIGLACCVSCSTNDPQKGSKTRTKQTAATHQDETWHYTAKEEDLKGAQQPVIKECGWGYVIIKMPNDGREKNQKDCVLTPKSCDEWAYKTFGEEFKKGTEVIKHITTKPGGTGVLPYAIKKLLQNAPKKDSNIVVIVSRGVKDYLGVNDRTKNYLKGLKKMVRLGNTIFSIQRKCLPNTTRVLKPVSKCTLCYILRAKRISSRRITNA